MNRAQPHQPRRKARRTHKTTIPTDRLLSLGMALYADRRTMEQRVRGVFARRRSARFARALAVLLCAALGFGCFTTACVPARPEAALSATQNAAQSATPPPLATNGGTTADDAVADAGSDGGARENGWFANLLREERRARTPLRVYDNDPGEELGRWTFIAAGTALSAPESEAKKAVAALLPVANALFGTDYTAAHTYAMFCRDKSGHRPDLWRIRTKDDERLVGVVRADTMEFVSADYRAEPGEALYRGSLEDGLSEAAARIAAIYSDTAGRVQPAGGYGGTSGSDAKQAAYFPLDDGRFIMMNLYWDDKLTLESVGVAPDEVCATEGVYWRADLRWAPDVVTLAHPQDFRQGAPGPDDLPLERAVAFYDAFVPAAGTKPGKTRDAEQRKPKATFYVDHSGVRENYWHIEGGALSLDLTAKTGHMLNAVANAGLGYRLDLTEIAYDEMGNTSYLSSTKALFEAAFGAGSVRDVSVNAVYDGHFCTVDPLMADGSGYEVQYLDGLIERITFYPALGQGLWYNNWEADFVYVNLETGETFLHF